MAAASEELNPQAYHQFCSKYGIKPERVRVPTFDPDVVADMLSDIDRFFHSVQLEVKNGNSLYLPPDEINHAIAELCKLGMRDEVNRIVKSYLGNLAPDAGVLQWLADKHLKESRPNVESSYAAHNRWD